MLGILISAAILMLLVKVVAQDDAEPEFWPMAGVALISSVASIAARVALSETLGAFAFLIGDIVLIPALMWIAGISLKQSAIVAGLYLVVQIVLAFALLALAGGA